MKETENWKKKINEIGNIPLQPWTRPNKRISTTCYENQNPDFCFFFCPLFRFYWIKQKIYVQNGTDRFRIHFYGCQPCLSALNNLFIEYLYSPRDSFASEWLTYILRFENHNAVWKSCARLYLQLTQRSLAYTYTHYLPTQLKKNWWPGNVSCVFEQIQPNQRNQRAQLL